MAYHHYRIDSSMPTPEPVEEAKFYLTPSKTKTRAETQIKMQLIMDSIHGNFDHIRFPRNMLAKPKQFASIEEREEMESLGKSLSVHFYLACASAIENPILHEQALRRARGEERIPRRPSNTALSELDKEHPSHPQKGGELLICEGCKERERKRFDRKKRPQEDEVEWTGYEADRIIMINEKEYKKFQDVDGEHMYSPRAKQVEFAMRIACYCRHQEEKLGYRVIFTFKDGGGNVVAQQTSEVLQITDDHKNKENPVPTYPAYPMEEQYALVPFSSAGLEASLGIEVTQASFSTAVPQASFSTAVPQASFSTVGTQAPFDPNMLVEDPPLWDYGFQWPPFPPWPQNFF